MPVYTITAPDGKEYDVTAPEGATQEQVLAYAKANYTSAATPAAPTAVSPAAPAPAAPGIVSQMFGMGSPIARFTKGAVVDPLLGVNQMLANTGLFGQDIKQGANKTIQSYEQATEEARKQMGSTGFDPYQLIGNILSPANKIVGAAAPATTLMGKTVSSSATGAGLAAMQPVTGEDYASKKLEQMSVGAVMGPLVEGGVAALGKLTDVVKGLTPTGRTQALKDYLNKLAGPDKEAVITALRDAKEVVRGSRPTAAEALSDVPTAVELVAAQQKLAQKTGIAPKFVERTAENQAARIRAINDIAGTEASRAEAAALRSTETGPMREEALAAANKAREALNTIDKQVLKEAGDALQQFKNTLPPLAQTSPAFQGTTQNIMAKASESAAALKEIQLKSLKENGIFPLETQPIIVNIDKAIKSTDSDVSKAVLQDVKRRLIEKTDENGLIGSNDLYTNVRKTSNTDIAKLLGLGDQYASGGIPQEAASVLKNVKNFVDSSLDKSTNGLWTKYLDNYVEHSKKLDRMEIGNYLSKKLQTPLGKEQAGVFASAVENADTTIKQALNNPRISELSKILSPKEMATVTNVVADLARKSKAEEMAGKVGALPAGTQDVKSAIPAVLSTPVTVVRAALGFIQRGNQKEFDKAMANLVMNPAELATFMTTSIPQSKIPALVSAMMKTMSPATRDAFVQSFAIPSLAQEAGR